MPQFQQRRDKLRSLLKKNKLPALLVTSEVNVTYLTGFTGDSSYLLVTADQDIILSDSRFTQQIQEECPDLKAEIRGPGVSLFDILKKTKKSCKLSHLGFEAAHLSVATLDQLKAKLSGTEWTPTTSLVEQLRAIKDKGEISEIRAAVKLAEQAFSVVKPSLRPDRTERDVAFEIEQQIRTFGGWECSFQPIVAVGPRAALPHAVPGDQKIADSSFVLIDWGARGNQYVSDITRIVVTGKPPAKLEKIYNVVLKANLAAIAKIKPGVSTRAIDAAARKVITDAGYGPQFSHGIGHGIGLQVHEGPRMAMDEDTPLKAGMVITVEPGIYFPGWGGVRIEDDILVTRNGHEVLTSVPKKFSDCVIS